MKIIIPIILLYSFYLFGRGPAVEPTIGISIEEQKAIRPEKAMGFDFSTEAEKIDYGTLKKSNMEELIVLLILLASLPLFFFIFLNLNKKNRIKNQSNENLEDLGENKKKAG